MSENKTKRTLEIITTIVAIVYCCIDLILDFIGLIDIIKLTNSYYYDIETSYVIGILIGLALVIAELVVAIMLLRKILSVYNDEETTKKLRVGFTVLSFVVLIILLIGLITGNTSVLGIIGLILFIGIVIIECIVLSMKNIYSNNVGVSNNNKINVTTNSSNPYNQYHIIKEKHNSENSDYKKEAKESFESKVNELKHLLSLKVITEEQFENAVQALAKEVINKE